VWVCQSRPPRLWATCPLSPSRCSASLLKTRRMWCDQMTMCGQSSECAFRQSHSITLHCTHREHTRTDIRLMIDETFVTQLCKLQLGNKLRGRRRLLQSGAICCGTLRMQLVAEQQSCATEFCNKLIPLSSILVSGSYTPDVVLRLYYVQYLQNCTVSNKMKISIVIERQLSSSTSTVQVTFSSFICPLPTQHPQCPAGCQPNSPPNDSPR